MQTREYWCRPAARLCILTGVFAVVAITGGIVPAADKVEASKADPAPAESDASLGREVADFILPDANGQQIALSDHADKRILVLFFMGTQCPISNLYLTELSALQQAHQDQGVQVICINSNMGAAPDEVRKHASEFKLTLPVLLDSQQRVADSLGASRTAEVFLLDAQRIVRYHGRVDDRFGYTYKNDKPRRRDLNIAVEELLAGKTVSVASTRPLGCLIARKKHSAGRSAVTYAKDVSRIIQRRCHECHRPGMVGPFSLLTFEDATKWTAMIKEVVLEKRMPPWHADPRWGRWSNSRQMPQSEVDTLVAWIDSGAPLGDVKDLPPPVQYAEGWVIDQPDIVFELPKEVTVQATGVVPYQYYVVPTNFKEDVWIQAAEARPGNRAVVHHIIVFFRTAKGMDWRDRGHICGTAPGDPPTVLPPGVALRVPAGAELLFQMHYTPTGKEEKDRSKVGLILYKGKEPPIGFAQTKGIMNTRFNIPAGEANHPVESSFTFREDMKLLSLMPHMHLRGKDFRYTATYPNGTREVLLSVPRYDFNWQNSYRFATPLSLPKGTKIDCLAHFDNSDGNPANPDPTKSVVWGDQTWEEMMIGWVGYIPDTRAATAEKATRPDADAEPEVDPK